MSEWTRLAGELAAWSTGSGPRLVFVHGFTQTSMSWKPIATTLAAGGYEAVIVDAPGHGESDTVRLDLTDAAALLVEQCGRAVYLGYSMGGRLCLHAAVADPDHVVALALISSSAGIEDDAARSERRMADEHLARRIEQIGVDAFLDEWLAQPLFADLELDAGQRAERSRNTASGLASSLRLAGAGAQHPRWTQLRQLTMPVLLMAGVRDHRYVAIAERMSAEIANATVRTVDGAGHAVHLQRPDQVVAELRHWLDGLT